MARKRKPAEATLSKDGLNVRIMFRGDIGPMICRYEKRIDNLKKRINELAATTMEMVEGLTQTELLEAKAAAFDQIRAAILRGQPVGHIIDAFEDEHGSDICDECDGSGTYYLNDQPQKCICSEPQE